MTLDEPGYTGNVAANVWLRAPPPSNDQSPIDIP
jgi:hypothetical protein